MVNSASFLVIYTFRMISLMLKELEANEISTFQNLSFILNTQVPRYPLFCEGGIYSTHAHTSVGTKLTSYI